MHTCGICGGWLYVLGELGRLVWFQCRDCGMQWSQDRATCPELEEEMAQEEV